MKPPDKALTTREAVRGRLNATGAARRDAIERARARGELPSYTDDELEEITGKFASISADAAARAVADALTDRESVTSVEISEERALKGRPWAKRLEHVAKVSGAIAGILAALTAFVHWALGLKR